MTRMDKWNDQDYDTREVVSSRGKVYKETKAKTLVSSVRYRPTTVATITQYLISTGEIPRSISDVIKLSMECFSDMILASGQARKFPDQTSAIIIAGLGCIGVISACEVAKWLLDVAN